MSRAKLDKLTAAVAALVAKRLAERVAPLAASELRAAGFQVQPCHAGDMVVVDEASGLDAKLAELEARGIKPPLVVVLRSFAGMSDAEAVTASAAWGAES